MASPLPAKGEATTADHEGSPLNSASQVKHSALARLGVEHPRKPPRQHPRQRSPFLDCAMIARSSMGTSCTSKKYGCLSIVAAPHWAAAGEQTGMEKNRRLLLSKLRLQSAGLLPRPRRSPSAAVLFASCPCHQDLLLLCSNITEGAVIAREIRKRAAIAKQPSKYDGIVLHHTQRPNPAVGCSIAKMKTPAALGPGLGSRCRRGWCLPTPSV